MNEVCSSAQARGLSDSTAQRSCVHGTNFPLLGKYVWCLQTSATAAALSHSTYCHFQVTSHHVAWSVAVNASLKRNKAFEEIKEYKIGIIKKKDNINFQAFPLGARDYIVSRYFISDEWVLGAGYHPAIISLSKQN